MIRTIKSYILMFALIFASGYISAQCTDTIKYRENIYDFEPLETLLKKPDCLDGYFPD